MHWASAIPLAPSDCQVAPASMLCQIVVCWAWHWVAGDPTNESQPSLSSTNAISGLTACGGSGRCSQPPPRSVERKRKSWATSAHTTFAEGALSWTKVGWGIGIDGRLSTPAVAEGVAAVGVERTGVGDAPEPPA